MKKTYGILFFIVLSVTLHAQIKKNTILLGGHLSYYNEKFGYDNSEKQKRQSAAIGILLGTAIKENSIIGINVSYSPTKQTNVFIGNDTMNTKSNFFQVGGFFRQYKKLAKDFYFFSQVDAAAIISNYTVVYTISTSDYKNNLKGALLSLTPGISYQVFKKMHLEVTIPGILGMQYLVSKYDNQNPQMKDSKQNQFSFYSNVNNNTSFNWLGVGFHFLL